MKPSLFLVVTLVGAALATEGCAEPVCMALSCVFQPAVTLNVVDAVDGGPVANPVANGIPCGSSGVCTPLQADGGIAGAGTNTFEVTAAGYGLVEIVVTVPAATPGGPCTCSDTFVPQTRTVALPPL